MRSGGTWKQNPPTNNIREVKIMNDDKMLRFNVLQMAQTMCDQEYLLGQEMKRDATAKYPTVNDVIKKAEVLMGFVNAPGTIGEQVRGSAELLNEG